MVHHHGRRHGKPPRVHLSELRKKRDDAHVEGNDPVANADDLNSLQNKYDNAGDTLHGESDTWPSRDGSRKPQRLAIYRRQAPPPPPGEPTTVIMTVIQVVLENGSTAAEFTVPTLPATVSNSDLGVVTIPAESDSPVVITPFPTATPTEQIGTSVAKASNGVSSLTSPTNGFNTTSSARSSSFLSDTSSNLSSGSSASSSPSPSTNVSKSPSTGPAPSSAVQSSPQPRPTSNRVETPSSGPVSSSLPTPSTSQSTFSEVVNSSIESLIPALSSFIASSSPSSILPPSASSSTSTTTSSTFLLSSDSSRTSSAASSSFTSTPNTSTNSSSSTSTSSSATSSLTSAGSESDLDVNGGGAGGPTDNGHAPEPTPSGEDSNGSDDAGVSVPKLVGGIFGGLAGAILLLLLILLLLRRRKRNLSQTQTLASGGSQQAASAAGANTRSVGDMSQSSNPNPLSSSIFGVTGAFARWRDSGQSIRAEEVAPTQRGFQKLGGRKITSVLESGGDGFDNNFGTTTRTNVTADPGGFSKEVGGAGAASAGALYARERRPHHQEEEGVASRSIPSPPLGRPESETSNYSEKVTVRPSPARTAVATPVEPVADIGMSATARSGLVSPAEPMPPPFLRRISSMDGIGRSHASADGSRTSRFTEGV